MTKSLVNNIKRGPLANCIAFHDFKREDVKGKDLFEYLVKFYEKNGLVPNRMALTIQGINSKTTITFVNGAKRLRQAREEDLKCFTIYALPPDNATDMADGIFDAYFEGKSFVLAFDDQILSYSIDLMCDLTKDLLTFIPSCYGYCYQRLFQKGPTFYPLGILVGLKYGDPERKTITKWGLDVESKHYKTGDFRDIYTLNIIGEPHLSRMINTTLSLKEWIASDIRYGTLSPLNEKIWAWSVEEEHIPLVRASLEPTGMLLAAA
jgi:hypothetical protein